MTIRVINLQSGDESVRNYTTDEAIANASAVLPPTPLQSLQALDTENQLTQRNLRETVMLMAEAFKAISGGAVDLSQIPGVSRVYEVEAQAQALREQL